jgi:pyruvate/2-oxoglutarate dehydrogenase complex dihydrolipoamide acyltransferase (E2) component
MNLEIVVPQVGEAISAARLVKWYRKTGDVIQKGMPLFAVDTDKAVLDVEAFCDGVLAEILVGEDQEVQPGMVVARFRDDGAAPNETPRLAPSTEAQPAGAERTEIPAPRPRPVGTAPLSSPRISPRARELARQLGIDPSLLSPFQPGGMITEKDVRAATSRLSE